MAAASPSSVDDTVSADFSQREEFESGVSSPTSPLPTAPAPSVPVVFFPTGHCNPGLTPPEFLVVPEALATIRPPPEVKTFAQRLDEISDVERSKYVEFRETVVIPRGWDASIDEWETLRFLVARQFDLKKATKMLETHMTWLAETSPKSVMCKACVADAGAHMQQFVGWDLVHRPVMYMSYKQCVDRANADNAIAHNVMVFESMKNIMSTGVEQWVAITDFVTYSHWNDGASGVGRKVIGIMQDHYPERLALQILVDPPTTFWVLFKALSPFIDEKTRSKVRFFYTEQEPRIQDEFPKLFPPHLSDYLVAKYLDNKESLKREKEAKKNGGKAAQIDA